MKLVHEEQGMIFRYIPAPRGNMYKVMANSKASREEVGEVKPFYMAEVPYCKDGKMQVNLSWWECLGISVALSKMPIPDWLKNIINEAETSLKNKEKHNETMNNQQKAYLAALLEILRIRMPTEFEWEWAALGGEDFEYAGCTNWEKTNSKKEEDVKQKMPNRYGLYDMTRVEGEWTSTAKSTAKGLRRIARGGGVDTDVPSHARVENRGWLKPGHRGSSFGVRFCIDADKVNP